MSKERRTRRGFALRDVLACVAVAAILTPALLAMGQARERARSAYCKSNISRIGKALAIYTAAFKDQWPWLIGSNEWSAATGAARLEKPTERTNYNVSALLFLLVRDGQDANIFICPSTADKPDPSTKTKVGGELVFINWDFSPWKDGNAEHVSYSYQCPFGDPNAGGSGVSSNSQAGLVVLADRTPAYDGLKPDFDWAKPGKDDPNTGMSQNHGGAVINLLYADLHVGESKGRADCGINNDSIYSASGKKDTEQGAGSLKLSDHLSVNDSFLVGPRKMDK